jgi:thioredoxin 1
MTNLLKRVFGGKEDTAATPSTNGNGTPQVEPIHVTDEDFDEIILQSDLPALVDLWAEWCGPCHMIAPSVQDLAAEYEGRAIIAKLNVDENPTTAGRFGIMGIPTLLYFKAGKEVDRQVGVAGYPQLASKLEKLLD